MEKKKIYKKNFKIKHGETEKSIAMMDAIRLNGIDTFLVFDCETTGIKASENYITQLSCAKIQIRPEGIDIVDRKGWLIKPPIPIPQELIDLHIGPTEEMLENAPTWSEVFPEIKEYFQNENVLVAHNAKFDISFMKKMYSLENAEFVEDIVIDTCSLARTLYVEAENHKLETLVRYKKLKKEIKTVLDGNFHDSDFDVVSTAFLLKAELSDWEMLMKTRRTVPAVSGIYLCNKMESGETLPPKNINTRFYTDVGEIRFNHYYREWYSEKMDLNYINITAFERNVRRYFIRENERTGKNNELAKLFVG
jgi:DNA polymerase III epsilon subunit family exonuclease